MALRSALPVLEPLTAQDRELLERVEEARADGVALKRWWDRTYPDGFAQKFNPERVFNRPADSFGFFDQVQLDRGVSAGNGQLSGDVL